MPRITPSTYENPTYPYRRSPDQDAERPTRHPAVIVGAGPVGLAAALALARQGVPSVVLDEDDTVSIGSRAICFAKRTLEICDRLGAGDRMVAKGVTWNLGKVFFRDGLVYEFNLLPEAGHERPAFINLQQYYGEEYLVDRAEAEPLVDLRWENEVVGVEPRGDGVAVTARTPEGDYTVEADYLLACDGVGSAVRRLLDLPLRGEDFDEHFLIADVTMGAGADFPTERWFWFAPPFNPGGSALLHKQPDGVWRIDLQLGPDIDREAELDPARIRARIREMLGPEVDFELEWTSIYRFRCLRLDRFVHGRVVFVGDSAHQISPFGARGANGGIQDADNLAWKLALVLRGAAPASLLDTYDAERGPAADENIRHSSQATDFISPKNPASLVFRNAALALAEGRPAMRRLVNSGRLSKPHRYLRSPLTTPDTDAFGGALQPGYPAADAPLTRDGEPTWLLRHLGDRFGLVVFTEGGQAPDLGGLTGGEILVEVVPVTPDPSVPGVLVDAEELFAKRYDALPGSWYLIRPDQHVAARGRTLDEEVIRAALRRATGHAPPVEPVAIEDRRPDYPHDARYNRLVKAHDGLSGEESARLNARLILLMMEQVESDEAFAELLTAAQVAEREAA